MSVFKSLVRTAKEPFVAEDRALTRETVPAAFFEDGAATPNAPGIRQAAGLADVFGAIVVLQDGAIMAPLQTFRLNAQGGREVVTEGETPALLRRPAPGVTQPAFVGGIVADLKLWGNAYIGKYPDADGSLGQLRLLSPDRVEVERVSGEPVFRYLPVNSPPIENLTLDDVVHIRSPFSLDGGLTGASPIRLCREAMSLGKSLAEAASATWTNGAEMAGLFTIPPGPGADDQAAALLGDLEERHKGPKNKGRLGVATGEVNFHQISMSAADAEFIETRRLSTLDVCRILHLPPWTLAAPTGDSLTYSTVEQQARAFVTFSLGAVLRLIETGLSADADLFPQPGTYAKFNLDDLLRADPAARAAHLTAALDPNKGWMTRAEARVIEDLPAEEATA